VLHELIRFLTTPENPADVAGVAFQVQLLLADSDGKGRHVGSSELTRESQSLRTPAHIFLKSRDHAYAAN
jgi:hypothetical protein